MPPSVIEITAESEIEPKTGRQTPDGVAFLSALKLDRLIVPASDVRICLGEKFRGRVRLGLHRPLLLLMLEAVINGPRFTISLKRSTKISSYQQAAGRLPYLLGHSGHREVVRAGWLGRE